MSALTNLDDARRAREEASTAVSSLKTGGGDGTSGEMEARVKALEDKFDKIDSKLTTIGNDISYLKGKSEGLPTAIAFGELKGRVDSLPTTAKMAGLIGIAVGLATIITKWVEIKAALGI
ncbi:hypothetical protein NKJ72_24340 [Mesorhizobium sp. M0045]|uniref:hypothetical protein n=1 Tax=Mesorhizobium sp. M0045 TaxID=2956857 RepID=UPI00333584F4